MKNEMILQPLTVHLGCLPTPYGRQAIQAMREQGIGNEMRANTCAALKSFCWDKTPEGGPYWREFYNSIEGRIDDQV